MSQKLVTQPSIVVNSHKKIKKKNSYFLVNVNSNITVRVLYSKLYIYIKSLLDRATNFYIISIGIAVSAKICLIGLKVSG